MNVIGMVQTAAMDEPSAAFQGADAREEPFAAFVGRHSRFVFRVAYAVLRNPHDAEDAVQETFLKLYRSRRWEQAEDEKAFLARTAWRVAVDRLPKSRGQTHQEDLPAPGANPEEAAIAANRTAILARLIDGLPEELRQPLALSSVEEMSSQQIARIMEIPESTVRGRLMRARQILKEKWVAYGR